MSEEKETLIATALLGDEAKRFMESEIGRFVLGLAKQEVELAKERFLEADPEDTKTIRHLQEDARCGQKFEAWLIGIMNDGEQSLAAFKQQQQQD